MIGRSLITIAALCTACAKAPEVAPPPETRAERLAVLERIADECRMPRAMIELVGEDELRLRPSPALAYEPVECVMRRVDRLNLPAGHVGFVGNEAHAAPPPPEANHAEAH